MEDLERLKFWCDKRVFVTGGTGIVGRELINRLSCYKAEVVALIRDQPPTSRLSDSWFENHSSVTLVRGELRDYDLLLRILAEYESEYIFHLGAQTIVGVGNRSPRTTFQANIEGTWNLLEAARVLNEYSPDIKAICVASSDKAYGTCSVLPYLEDTPLQGEHPYDVSKSCIDLIAQSYAKTYGLPISIARMGNIYGPGDFNFNGIIPGTIKSVIRGMAPEIRSDGTPIREYFFVADAVDAYLTLAEKSSNLKMPGEAFNFSSGEKHSVLEIVNTIISIMDSSLTPILLNSGKNEIQNQYLSIEKAERILHWHPTHSLVNGLEKTIAWYRKVLA